MNLEVMAMKRYSIFPKTLGLELHHQFGVIPRMIIGVGESYPAVEMQLSFSTASNNCAECFFYFQNKNLEFKL